MWIQLDPGLQDFLRRQGWTGEPRLAADQIDEVIAQGVADGLRYHDATARFLSVFYRLWISTAPGVVGRGDCFDASMRYCFRAEDQARVCEELGGHWDPVAVAAEQWGSLWLASHGSIVAIQHEGGGWFFLGETVSDALNRLWWPSLDHDVRRFGRPLGF